MQGTLPHLVEHTDRQVYRCIPMFSFLLNSVDGWGLRRDVTNEKKQELNAEYKAQ